MNHKEVYAKLISKAKARALTRKDCYIERHHVVPRSEGGSDDADNLVSLTAREHYVAHLLLAKIYDDSRMYSAVVFMHAREGKEAFRFNSRLYEALRTEFGRRTSAEQKGKQAGAANPMYGKSIFDFMTPEKIAAWKVRHAQACAKWRGLPPPMAGRHHSDGAKARISKFMKGFRWWNDGQKAVRSHERPGPEFVPGRLKLTSEWRQKIAASVNARKGGWHDKLVNVMQDENVRRKISEARKRRIGYRWWNDGKAETLCAERPDGFKPGRLPRSR